MEEEAEDRRKREKSHNNGWGDYMTGVWRRNETA